MAEEFTITEYSRKKWTIIGIVATLIIALSLPLYLLKTEILFPRPTTRPLSLDTFVGKEKCVECHQPEYKKWLNSHHDKAMDVATDNTVLGDFNDNVFKDNGITARFFRKKDLFYVHTQGPDGILADFQITHTFGVYPLQQYLIPFSGGRLQCLSIAWDIERKKWYSLPNRVNNPTDWLHWTKAGQNWNGMCAECHTTNLTKGYNLETDSFQTTWSEMDVSCEACHGPSSQHVTWAEKPAMAREQTDNFKLTVKTKNITSKEQLALCARCHSRRGLLGDYKHSNKDLMDSMIPQLLSEGLYYPDGQILDEVFVFGSFAQSKMFEKDVKCGDCHDAHSQKLILEGNALCLQCHRTDIYDTEKHHFHKAVYQGKASSGDDCVSCHMPQKIYMGVDARADHSLRIPRPDLSHEIGSPNACASNGCHHDKPTDWLIKAISKWYGLRSRPHYGSILAAARNRKPGVHMELIRLIKDPLIPLMVRATAISLLGPYGNEVTLKILEEALADEEAIIRYTALTTMEQFQFEKKSDLIIPMLDDPAKAVRIQAAISLATITSKQLTATQEKVFRSALLEYQKAMEYAADFPSGRFNLANMYNSLNKPERAIENYKASIGIDDQFFASKNNLAMLYARIGKKAEAEKLFREILALQPDLHDISYSLGLLLVEQKRYGEAVDPLKKAAAGLPKRTRIHYNLALLLQHLKRYKEAEKAFTRALNLEPDNFDILYAIADFFIKRGRLNEAVPVAQALIKKHPGNKAGHQLLKYIIDTQRAGQKR
ncbi:tetratricopeptide repeat protein [bacterium]|nr:tetratricopeptide repeat protein [bacterium]